MSIIMDMRPHMEIYVHYRTGAKTRGSLFVLDNETYRVLACHLVPK